jgi:hypothetical protein
MLRLARGAFALALLHCADHAPPSDASDQVDATSTADACASDSAMCPVCVPGAIDCTPDGSGTRRCNPDGLGFTAVVHCNTAGGELCSNAQCVVPCAQAAMDRSYQGCEFWAVGLLDSSLAADFEDVSADDFPLAIALTNPWPVPATVMLEGGGLAGSLMYTIDAHGADVIPLPWVRALSVGGDATQPSSALVTNGAVHVQSSLPVGAYQFNPRGFELSDGCDGRQCYAYSNDASLLLPVASLRNQYVAVTRPTVRVKPSDRTRWLLSSGFVTIVGTQPGGTDVTVTAGGATASGPGLASVQPGGRIQQHLNAGDVLQILSPNDPTCASPEPDPVYGDVYCTPVAAEDLTGTLVEASAPVAVFSGHDCALVPYNRFACDHLEEQLFPSESLGVHYIVPRIPPVADEPDVLRVVATRAGTRVSFAPASAHAPVVLAAGGDNAEFEIRASVEVTSDTPLLVAEFLVGGNYDRATDTDRAGDPDMVLSVPVDQYRNAYDFVAEDGFGTSTAVVVVPHTESVSLDGQPVTTPPREQVGDYDVIAVPVYQGPHHIESVHPGVRFGLTVSGVELYTSYTYPGGLDLAPISPPL